jgi:hypothetical protein
MPQGKPPHTKPSTVTYRTIIYPYPVPSVNRPRYHEGGFFIAQNRKEKTTMATNYDEKIAGIEEQITQLKNRQRELIQKSKAQARNARTKRLVERGAIAEGLIPGADEMTGDQFKSFLEKVLSSAQAQRFPETAARGGTRSEKAADSSRESS